MPGNPRVPRPFVKWAGGKDQLLGLISQNLPSEPFRRYFEPFLGGGAVFFFLYRNGFRGKVYLSDLNEELITAYKTIKRKVEPLITELQSGEYLNDETTFYEIRKWDREPGWKKINPVIKTARMIYLNKTCYNGLYRVNKDGQFNVPFGRYTDPPILDAENLRVVSTALKMVKISCKDFEKTAKKAKARDFVYFDPPYDPLTSTSNFTQYTANGFKEDQQERLSRLFFKLTKKRCFVLQSNADTAFIRQLYAAHQIYTIEVAAKRAISCDPNGRGEISELLIRNYPETWQKTLP